MACHVSLGCMPYRARGAVVLTVANDMEPQRTASREPIDLGRLDASSGKVVERTGRTFQVRREPPLWTMTGVAAAGAKGAAIPTRY
ncbi:MAG: hypothetical protein Q7U75_04045 [Desulfobacterales bacterium]|nr:hypothetical protein [Desulfobacterales bacterium]